MDSTYAPQSPDLSSFLSSKPPQPQQEQSYRPQQPTEQSYNTSSSSYAPRSPTLPFDQSGPHQTQHQGQHQGQLQDQHHLYPFPQGQISSPYSPPVPLLQTPQLPQSFGAPTSSPFHNQPIKPESSSSNLYDSAYDPAPSMSRAPRGSRVKDEPPSTMLSSTLNKPPPPSIDIRTKFPVARIKRIMQADEEVGKVAQVTPVAVNKALELFMTALVLGAAERVREKGGKRITAAHLKSVVEADEQFDFLGEIVGRVQDGVETEKKKKAGKESESDDDSGERKVKKGKGRRKKADD